MPALFVFDLDRTLFKINSSYSFSLYLFKLKELNIFHLIYAVFYYVRHRFFNLSFKEYHHRLFNRLLKHKSLAKLEESARSFIDEILYSNLNTHVHEILKRAQNLGNYTVILSSSPDFLVKRVATLLNVDEYHATQYGLNLEGHLSHIALILDGNRKAQIVAGLSRSLGIPKSEIYAFSDSILDLSMLLEAGHPNAVNPDKRLLKISKNKMWNIH